MIDLNAHVLPGLDDGPGMETDAQAAVEQAWRDGTRVLVAAAHANDGHFEVDADRYRRTFASAQERIKAAGHAVQLVSAMEIRLGPDVPMGLREGRYLAIGSSGYVCVELPVNDFPAWGFDVMHQVQLDGWRVMLIHPERSRGVRRFPEVRERLAQMGIFGVATAGSVLGQFGPDVESAAFELIDCGFVQSVASDGHSLTRRPFRLSPVRELLARRYGESEAEYMMETVPERILDGQVISLAPHQGLGWRRWQAGR